MQWHCFANDMLLQANRFIRTLILRNNNQIGVDGTKALARSLSENRCVTLLDLRGNNSIGAEGGAALAACVKANPALLVFVDKLELLGDDARTELKVRLAAVSRLHSCSRNAPSSGSS